METVLIVVGECVCVCVCVCEGGGVVCVHLGGPVSGSNKPGRG